MIFSSPVFLGFLCTFSLFLSCFLAVAAVKAAVFYVKKFFGKVYPQKPAPKKRTVKKPAAVRSIEINPEEIDRIYVKKIS